MFRIDEKRARKMKLTVAPYHHSDITPSDIPLKIKGNDYLLAEVVLSDKWETIVFDFPAEYQERNQNRFPNHLHQQRFCTHRPAAFL